MVTLYGDKMSKSTQHYIAIKDFLKKYPAEVLRLIFLSVSYHQSINFTFETALQALKKLAKIYRFNALVDSYALQSAADDAELLDHENTFQEVIFVELEDVISKMRRHLFDDLNSSAALAVFFDLMRGVNSRLNVFEKQVKKMNEQDRQLLKIQWPTFKDWFKKVFGLTLQQPEIFFDDLKKYNIRSEISIVEIQRKIEERSQARYHKQWEKSDALRKELLGHGVQIQDSPKGTKWTLIL
jgi:cysteinyl-tRNA synthetase